MTSWVHDALIRLRSRWLGRVVVDGIEAFLRLDMFDRSMTIAAQFFTSVFPILILLTTWAASRGADELADATGIPDETRSALEVSADRYGPVGDAFTYLACLYTASLCFLATAVLGRVIAVDGGKVGRWIRRTSPSDPDDVTGDPATAVAGERGRDRPAHCRAMAMRRRSSGSMKWSLSSAPRSTWIQWILPVNRLVAAV